MWLVVRANCWHSGAAHVSISRSHVSETYQMLEFDSFLFLLLEKSFWEWFFEERRTKPKASQILARDLKTWGPIWAATTVLQMWKVLGRPHSFILPRKAFDVLYWWHSDSNHLFWHRLAVWCFNFEESMNKIRGLHLATLYGDANPQGIENCTVWPVDGNWTRDL